MTPTTPLLLDPVLVAEARLERRRRFHLEEVPRLRLVGFAFNAFGVIVHNWLVQDTLTLGGGLFTTSVIVGYALLAWLALRLFWERTRPWLNLGNVFLTLDVVVLMFVVYVTGANQSLIWFVFVARAADQVASSFRQSMFFAHLGPLAYLTLVVWVGFGEGRDVNWSVETCKIAFLYTLCLYIGLSSKAVEARRRKFSAARRVAEQAVRQADDRRRDLESALARLEAANRTKSEFLANVSHEIRTPLNSVIGTSDLLLDTALSRDQREMLGVVRDSAESLTRIVDDILDLSKIEARRLPLESIPLRIRDLASSTVRMFAARAHQKNLELVCHVSRAVPDGLVGDPHRLRQIMANLLSNAIKFTGAGEVILRVELEGQRDARVALRFSVRDTGIGIARSKQQAIFEAFTQADGSNTRQYGGTGLGLTIAAELAALMDGRLWVESEEGRGSTFSFIAWFGRPVHEDAELAPWGSATVSVLLADGHGPTRAALVDLVAPWPVRLVEAAGGRAALAALELAAQSQQPFDVVLLDAGLPGLDGFELAARIHATRGLAKQVVLLLHTNQQVTGSDRAIALGAGYLVKPLMPQAVADTLATAAGALPRATPAKGPRKARHSLRVLVVDDHVVNQAVVSAALRKWGHAVALASDGQEAVVKTANESFDIVLMDLQMPVMDGLQATTRIRAREVAADGGARRVPIIAMTARAMTEDRDECRTAGMDGFLPKPINQQELFEILEIVGKSNPGSAGDAILEPAAITPLIGDAAVTRHIAELFLGTAPSQMERLRAAIADGASADVASVAHSLRGAMANFAGVDTSALVRLEEMGRASELHQTAEVFAAVHLEILRLEERLRHYLGQSS